MSCRRPRYVGRVAERERMGELWGQAREGSLRLALIGGEAGVGKTRLSTHLALAGTRGGRDGAVWAL